ncbi:MAG: four helix bundle protein, partial [Chloroflexi bacterium]|nr:four helix bundle protein [Chloroflexota bacterium]
SPFGWLHAFQLRSSYPTFSITFHGITFLLHSLPEAVVLYSNKFETALQELDETDYWLELLVKAQILPNQKVESLRKETSELLAIFTTIVTKIKNRMKKK